MTILGPGTYRVADLPDSSNSKSFQAQQLKRSLELCTFVLHSIEGRAISQDELYRLQRILHLRSIIYRALCDQREWEDLFRGIELALNSNDPCRDPPYTTDDLILAVHLIGSLACIDQVCPSQGLEDIIKVTDELRRKISPDFDIFAFVKENSDRLLDVVGESPPVLLLSPAEALYLPAAIWAPVHPLSPPSLVSRFSTPGSLNRDDMSAITGRLLSTLASRIAEVAREVNNFGPDASEVRPYRKHSNFRPNDSVVLLLRYAALGLAPSPEAFKALGDLISTADGNTVKVMVRETGSEMKLDVAEVAMLYYDFGMKAHY